MIYYYDYSAFVTLQMWILFSLSNFDFEGYIFKYILLRFF